MRLILGTAAFGTKYGANGYPKPTRAQVEDILDVARAGGITMVDTAPAYGDMPEFDGFDVVTKTPWDGSDAYAVLVHDPDGVTEMRALARRRNYGVGISVYTPAQLERALAFPLEMDVVQIPLSIADGRFLPYLEELHLRGIEVHARSVFLQGALLMDSPPIEVPRRTVAECLGFALAQLVDGVVVGVHTAAQLEELLAVEPLPQECLHLPDHVVDPRLWR